MVHSLTSSMNKRLIVGLLVIMLLISGFGPVAARSVRSVEAQAAFDFTIYDDELASGWEDWSWDTDRSFNNPAPVHSGSASIAVTYTVKWGGLYLHTNTALPASGYTAIQFWVHGGSSGGQSVNFHANEGGGNYTFTVPANTWLFVTVPLTVLGNPTTLSDLFWQDNSGGSQPTFYLDDIKLIGTPPFNGWLVWAERISMLRPLSNLS